MRMTDAVMAPVYNRRVSTPPVGVRELGLPNNIRPGRLRRTQSAASFRNRMSKLVSQFTPINVSTDVSSHRGNWMDLPLYKIQVLSSNTFARFSGPDGGLVNASLNEKIRRADWDVHHDRAFGTAVSLYEFKKSQNCRAGSPIADVFAIVATENGAIMALADGVGWGSKSRLAAQCAVRGCMEYLERQLLGDYPPKTTHDLYKTLRTSLDHGQNLILISESTLTTICLAVVVKLQRADQFILCVVNVGDTLAFVYSPKNGVREVTTGCRDLQLDRDLCVCGGALGPAIGEQPDLDNLTFSFTMLEKDDVVFLASDGITDNFDPAIAMTARISDFKFKRPDESLPLIHTTDRHPLSTVAMTKILQNMGRHEPGEDTAMLVCGRFIQYVVKLTNPYRVSLEKYETDICKSDLSKEDKETLKMQQRNVMYTQPGKLDHSSIVAFTVGDVKQEGAVLKSQEMTVYPS